MLFMDVVGEILEEQQYKGNSKATTIYYRDRLTWYHTFSQIETIEEFTERSIRRWLMSYTDVARNSLANYDRALRVFANWVYRRGFVTKHPMADLPKPKEQKTQLITFSPDDIIPFSRIPTD